MDHAIMLHISDSLNFEYIEITFRYDNQFVP